MTNVIQATAHTIYPAATRPTMYFIGVTTGQSSIMNIFPRWVEYLGLGDVELCGIDCRLHDQPAVYRRVVEHIRQDALSRGALVTSHKIDLLKACCDLFDRLDAPAERMGEVSSISKQGGQLVGHAIDAVTSGLALEAFLPRDHWVETAGHVFILGAGGSSIAFSSYLMDSRHAANRPRKVIVANRSTRRLDEMRRIHAQADGGIQVDYRHVPRPEDSDAIMSELPDGSLVVNATGLGKDAPGSPITDAAVFPRNGYAWDFNYRGELDFLRQAHAQRDRRSLTVEDGWVYFIHGWTRVIAQVFQADVPTHGAAFERLCDIAAAARA